MDSLFNLRGLVLAAPFVLVVNATPCVAAEANAEATIRQIEALYGHVTRRADGTVSHIYTSRKFSDKDLELFSALEEVQFVYLERAAITDDGLKIVATLPHLEYVMMPPQITDAGLAHLADVGLRFMELPDGITDAGMVHVAAMKGLTRLKLSPRITDEGFKHARGLVALMDIDFARSRVSDQGLRSISELPRLLSVDLSHAPNITIDGVRHLQSLPNLQELRGPRGTDDHMLALLAPITSMRHLHLADSPKVTDDGLRHLVDMKWMSTLELGPGVTDAGMVHIGKFRKLRMLDLRKTRVTGEGLRDVWETCLSRIYLPLTVGDQGLWHLADFRAYIEVVALEGDSYTDAAIPHLANIKGLRGLRLINTKISGDGIKLMKKLKPQVEIIFR